jgi:hypothetical protein
VPKLLFRTANAWILAGDASTHSGRLRFDALAQLVIAPEDASVAGARFLYRVSIADVASDGPFSRFPGCDRHIMLLGGAGMTLDCGEHGRIELREAYEPRTFSGDWEVNGVLVDGAVRDLNVIVDRAAASSTLETRVLTADEAIACEPGNVCVVHVLEGALAGAEQGDTLVADAPFELSPRGPARVAIARIAPRRGSPSA